IVFIIVIWNGKETGRSTFAASFFNLNLYFKNNQTPTPIMLGKRLIDFIATWGEMETANMEMIPISTILFTSVLFIFVQQVLEMDGFLFLWEILAQY
ncbi:hypothetical protein ACJX0J_017067, partial [Zea mays]